jgi:cephalosporin hydroxylase
MLTLSSIANKHKTDKGTVYYEAHGYTEIYEKFIPRDKEISLFEIGVWHGDSIRMWNEYNPSINLYAMDIDPNVVNFFTGKEKVNFILGDQKNTKILDDIIQSAINTTGNLDVVIDDGSHNYNDIIASFTHIFPQMTTGGVYFIEDLHAPFAEKDKLLRFITKFIFDNEIGVSKIDFFCDDKLMMLIKK